MESLNFPVDLSDLQTKLNPFLQTILASPAVQSAKPSTTADGVAVVLFLLSALGYITRGRIWDKPDPHHGIWFERPQLQDGASSGRTATTRDVSQKLSEGDYHCVIFWGSQSGTSERFAETLGRECLSHFGINALVADISDYDAESISKIQSTHFAIFLLSTYGEGDPSDNTAGLWDYLKQVQDKKTRLEGLRYFAFGLGNSNYKYYNRVLDVVADTLDNAGANALIPRQKADDANDGTEEDFQAWKDNAFALFRQLGFKQKTVAYQPTIELNFGAGAEGNRGDDITHAMSLVHQQTSSQSAIVPLTIKSAHELFAAGDRNCVHLELDLGNHDIVYKTGDHIGIWPCNPDEEIERLLKVLGVQSRKDEVFSITSDLDSVKPKVPSPTTLETTFRHHLEICAPVARKTIQDIVQFAPTPEAQATLLEIGQSRERYEHLTSTTHITLARLLESASAGEPWTSLPLAFVLENLLPLQPRYYSISSSSVITPRRIAVTALVVNKPVNGNSAIQGLTSNYLLSASDVASNATIPTPTYQRMSEGQGLHGSKVLAHVRKSKFKLPITSSTPLVLISAGTGFAPFRAFLQERAKLHAIGKPVGKILLFFGCRNEDDFIYQEELKRIQTELGEKLKIVTAFSRNGTKKYVQDRIDEYSSEVLGLLEAGANMYICGKASMAREVDMKLEHARSKANGLGEAEVKAWADSLKKRGKWRADVWG
ncbi:hypothetical protein E8E13_009258 [Curvularia kusanoi]|uniref:NADPH--cytochrome P450 reductase n=1 Tax=Curvularia kusanoi TaxID=90978 RepID=A0A9P4THZ4_CURKU|nr:hypothetical protein E8E13_009258 [Curvularia kusanoi]